MDDLQVPSPRTHHASPPHSVYGDDSQLESDEHEIDSDSDSQVFDPLETFCLQNSYSCESVYMQCYDAAKDTDSMTNYSQRPDTDPKMSTLNLGFEYYRPTQGKVVSMSKLTDSEKHISSFDEVYGTERSRSSLSPSMQSRAKQAYAANNLRLSRESRMSQVSATMELPDESDVESESCNPEYFIGSLDLPERERSSSLATVVHPLAEPKYHASYQGFPSSPRHYNNGRNEGIQENNREEQGDATKELYGESDALDTQSTGAWTWFTSRTDPPPAPPPIKSNVDTEKETLAADPLMKDQKEQGTQMDPSPSNQSPSELTKSKTESTLTSNSEKMESKSEIKKITPKKDFNSADELGLDSLKTSKAEQLDEMYTDRNNEVEDNKCMWILFKILTWTILVVIAVCVLMCGKLSVIVLSQSILAPVDISKIPILRNGNLPVSDLGGASISSNLTKTACHSYQVQRLSSNPALLGSFVYSQNTSAYLDKTVIVMWMFLLLLPPVIGLISGVYSYIRWQSVRRTSLSWKSVIVTFLASLFEAMGITLFLFQVLPHMDGTWGLILPGLVMIIPSAVRLGHGLKGYSVCKKIIGWTFLFTHNAMAVLLIYLTITGVIFNEEPNVRLLWTLPLSVLSVSLAWIPTVLTWQVEGTYKTTEIEDLDSEINIDKLQDRKRTGLRAKHKLLASFCKCIWYPLAVFTVLVLFEGFDVLLRIQNHFVSTWKNNILHHPMVPYFVINIVATIFSPLAVWVVFTAAIEFQVSFKGCIRRPVSGSFFILLLTVILTVCLAVTNVPCLVTCPSLLCLAMDSWKILVIVSVALLLFLGNLPVIYNVMIANHAIFIPIDKVFTLASGTSVLMDPWVWVNVTSSSLHQRARIPDFRAQRERSKIYICTTMYREDEKEMLELLKSIKRINDSRGPSKPLYEAHVFFDGALSVDPNGKTKFNGFALQLIALVERTFDTKLEQFGQKSTPYGIQWEVLLWTEGVKKPMTLYIHLKDNSKVKKKKRWSQIMYMVWALEHEAEVPVEDRYVLITDGDTKFYEKGPVALLDALLISPEAAAVVGRVRPVITSSPLVWYQVFEYAASFWLYKASNDQLGSDLCCSGCFTIYRGSMLREVIKDYATEANNARDFLMIDMGEDLWLSTLLIRCGYKLKYSSVADVYTQAPSKLEEYYKQRRRWYLSSLAYFFFFIGELRRFKFGNRHITLPFLFYQGMLLFFPLISTSTLGVVLAVAQSYAFTIPFVWSAVIVAVIFIAQHLVCLFFPSHIQIKASAVLSILPSLSTIGIVVVVLMNSCKDYIVAFTPINGTTLANSRLAMMESPVPLPSLMLTVLVALVILTGLLHPKEFYYIFYVVFYIIGNPVGYIFLRAYMLCNVTDQSWGTREGKSSSSVDDGALSRLRGCCTTAVCCRSKPTAQSTNVPDIIVGTTPAESADSGMDSGNTSQAYGSDQLSSIQTNLSTLESNITEKDTISLAESKTESLIIEMVEMDLTDAVKERMLALKDELELRTETYTTALDKEDRFWERLIELKLSNVETAAHRRSHQQVQEGLRRFQRRMLIVYFAMNILWMCILGLFWYYFGQRITMSSWGRHFDIVVIIAIPYLLVNIVQFVAMFIHRMGIWLYLLARRKCKLGDVIMCGYPTNQSPDLCSDVTRATANENHGYRYSTQEMGKPAIHTVMTDYSYQASSSPGQLSGLRHQPSDRWSDPAMTSYPPLQGSPFTSPMLVTRGQHPSLSRFQDSRWLGPADRGMLTHEDAARRMAHSASHESLNQLMASRGSHMLGGSSGQLTWSYSDPNLQHIANGKDFRPSSVTPIQAFSLPRATPPSGKRYRIQSGTVNTRSSESPLFRRAANQRLRRFDVSENPENFMHNVAKRTAELQRFSS